MKKIVSIKDIARMAGVAPSTVSAVINGKTRQARISLAKVEMVKQVILQTGYLPNQAAVSLRTGKTRVIGLIVEDISNSFFAALAKQVEAKVYAQGYKIVYCSTDNREEQGREMIRVLSRQVDGFIITPTAGMEEDIRQLIAHGKPVVLIDRYLPGLNVAASLVDNEAGVREGMRHLLGKGYTRIAFVTVTHELVQMQLREQGYVTEMKAAGIRPSILKIPYVAEQEDVIEHINGFLQSEKPDAIFFSTNYVGLAGLEAIRRCGMTIPGDIAVICFDDNETFRLFTPGITALEQPIQAIAHEAIQMLMDIFQGSGEGQDMSGTGLRMFAPKLLLRSST